MDPDAHPDILEETPPVFLLEVYYTAAHLISNYGWLMLGGGLLIAYIWYRLKPAYDLFQRTREEKTYQALLHKNPDLLTTRQQEVQAARDKLQQEHDRMAQLAMEKRLEQERQRRENLPDAPGHRLDSQGTGSFKPEYQPLGSSGTLGSYRAQRRGCPGGGCGS